jgi:urease accessory protein
LTITTNEVTVRLLPAAIARYEDEPLQLAAGSSGKRGLLKLGFAVRGQRTQLISAYASGPQRVQRALHLDPSLPQMAYAIIQSVSGGILQGDRLAVDIEAGPQARVHVTTQSATKLYRMEHNYATQRLNVQAAQGAYVEFLPDYLIPYRGARLYQEIDLCVADDATLLFSDAVAGGRVNSGELFAYDLLFTRLNARNTDGALRLVDTVVLEPGRTTPSDPGLLGRHNSFGTLYVFTHMTGAAELADTLYQSLQGVSGVDAGASRLPYGAGVVVRILGENMGLVQAALHRTWQVTRQVLLGVGVPPLHSMKYGREPGQME